MSVIWKLLLAWYIISSIVLVLSGNWRLVLFSSTFGGLFGGTVFFLGPRLRKYIFAHNIDRFPVFLVLGLAVSAFEETYVYILGNSIAVPDLTLDLILVPAEWAVWFTAWYYIIARRYSFTDGEALFAAGLAGLMYEYAGKFFLLGNPLGLVISIPGTIIVYAAIFILPMQVMEFRGDRKGILRYPIAAVVPYLLSLPVAVVFYIFYS